MVSNRAPLALGCHRPDRALDANVDEGRRAMASRTRRARVVLAVVALAVVGLVVWRGEAVYWWVMTKKELHWGVDELEDRRGWYRVKRWDEGQQHGMGITWNSKSGFMASREYWSHGTPVRFTRWRPWDGTVWVQTLCSQDPTREGMTIEDERHSPPWLWNVTDQTAPSIPAWMKDDEQWQRALDAQD